MQFRMWFFTLGLSSLSRARGWEGGCIKQDNRAADSPRNSSCCKGSSLVRLGKRVGPIWIGGRGSPDWFPQAVSGFCTGGYNYAMIYFEPLL